MGGPMITEVIRDLSYRLFRKILPSLSFPHDHSHSNMIPFCPEALLSHGYCQPDPRGRVATLCGGPWTKVGQGTCRTGRGQPVVLLGSPTNPC